MRLPLAERNGVCVPKLYTKRMPSVNSIHSTVTAGGHKLWKYKSNWYDNDFCRKRNHWGTQQCELVVHS